MTDDGQPLFALSDEELLSVFRDVQVRLGGGEYISSMERFRAGGIYSAAGGWWARGRFWVADGELCATVEGQTGTMLCRRFARAADGAVYEISGSRGLVRHPYKYDLEPIPSGAHEDLDVLDVQDYIEATRKLPSPF